MGGKGANQASGLRLRSGVGAGLAEAGVVGMAPVVGGLVWVGPSGEGGVATAVAHAAPAVERNAVKRTKRSIDRMRRLPKLGRSFYRACSLASRWRELRFEAAGLV